MAIKFAPKPEPEAVPATASTQDRDPENFTPATGAKPAQPKKASKSGKADKTPTEKDSELF